MAEELTRAGHSVSERTAQRWKKGETSPKPQDIRAIRELIGATLPETPKSAAPPYWAERLLAGTMALERKLELSDSELADATALAAAWVAVEEDRRRRGQSSGGGQAGSTP